MYTRVPGVQLEGIDGADEAPVEPADLELLDLHEDEVQRDEEHISGGGDVIIEEEEVEADDEDEISEHGKEIVLTGKLKNPPF